MNMDVLLCPQAPYRPITTGQQHLRQNVLIIGVWVHIFIQAHADQINQTHTDLIVKMHLKSVHPNLSQSIYFCFRHAKWAQWPYTLVKSSVGEIQDPHRSTSRVLSHHKLQEVSHRSPSTSPKSNHLLSCKWVTQKQFMWALNCN